MSKFKIGDKVIITSLPTSLSTKEANIGDIGVVSGVTSNGWFRVECKNFTWYDGEPKGHWYFEDHNLKIYEVKQPTSYREMNPDSTVKVKIGDYEFDCPVKELLIVDALSGNIVGHPRTSVFFDNIEKALDTEHLDLCELISDIIKVTNAEDFYKEYFKPFYDKQEEKDLLLKDIEEQKTILKNQEEFLKELEDKYNSL